MESSNDSKYEVVYYFIHVKWKSGFKHIMPARQENVKSMLKFLESLSMVESYKPKRVSRETYSKRFTIYC